MSDIDTAANQLRERVDFHRCVEERGITCRTNCWCWDAEALLLALESAQPSPQRTEDRLCENCHEPMSQHVGSHKICKNGEWNNWGNPSRRPASQ